MASPDVADLASASGMLGHDHDHDNHHDTVDMDDPFVSHSPAKELRPSHSHRYSSFDSQLININSPSQAKRALEAHLAETERRLQEASRLGTTLVQQRTELAEKLREVESKQKEGEIGPELRRKLADLEKEYNDVGRESARAFLAPKKSSALEENAPVLDSKVGSNFEDKFRGC